MTSRHGSASCRSTTHTHTVFYASARCRAKAVQYTHTHWTLSAPLSLSFRFLSFPLFQTTGATPSIRYVGGRWQIFCYAIIGSLSLHVSYLCASHSLAGMGKSLLQLERIEVTQDAWAQLFEAVNQLGRAWQAALSPYGPGNVHKFPIMLSGAERTDAHMCHWTGFFSLRISDIWRRQSLWSQSFSFLLAS